MSPWLLGALGLLNFVGGQSSANQAAESNKLGAEQIKMQRELFDYMMKRRKDVYDPLEDYRVIPGMFERLDQDLPYQADVDKSLTNLRTPMRLR